MICKNCGKEFDEGIFCPYCGTKNDTITESNKTIKFDMKWIALLIPILMIVSAFIVIADTKKESKFAESVPDDGGTVVATRLGSESKDLENSIDKTGLERDLDESYEAVVELDCIRTAVIAHSTT